MNKDIKLLSPFKKMLITIGELPTAYIESMSYYEGLTYLVNYLCNNVIPALNQNGEAVKELQDKYLELVSYVDNYFKNLDIQTEINNKLDDMASKGELAPIITQYLEMYSLLMFDTVADLKAAENISKNSFASILGRYTYGDGLGAKYKIRELDPSDVIDDYNLISLTNYPTLVAERIDSKRITDIEGNIASIGDTITNINTSITGINNKIGELSNLHTSDKTSIVNAINDNRSYANTKMSEFLGYKLQHYYYIDGVSGDDTNDGLSSDHAFKTIDRFFELINTSSTDVRCHIISAGTYKCSKTNIFNGNIHIVGDVPGVYLTSDQDELVFYGGHINLKNITWNMPSNYFDNCLVSIDDCIIELPMRIYGGAINMSDTTINQLRLSWTKGVLDNITIDGQEKTNNAIHCDSSTDLTIFNNLTISNLATPTDYGVIGLYRATLYYIATIVNNSNSVYKNGIISNHAIIDSTTSNISAIESVGSSGNSFNHTLLFTGNVTLPA